MEINRTAKHLHSVGTWMSNNVALYKIDPPCSCGEDTVSVDDYWTGDVQCQKCKHTIFDAFNPEF